MNAYFCYITLVERKTLIVKDLYAIAMGFEKMAKYYLLIYLLFAAYYSVFGAEPPSNNQIFHSHAITPGEEPKDGDKTRILDFSEFCHGEALTTQLAEEGIEIMVKTNDGTLEVPVVVDMKLCENPSDLDHKDAIVIPASISDSNADGLVEDPCASDNGGQMYFIFGEDKEVGSFYFIGEEDDTEVRVTAFDAYGATIKHVDLKGQGGEATVVNVEVEDVRILCIEYDGHGAVTGLEISCVDICEAKPATHCDKFSIAPDGTR